MSTDANKIPAIILGGSGYVAGEFLRLLAGHPELALGGVVSTSQAGEPVAKTFPHLAPTYPETTFVSLEAVVERLNTAPRWLLLSAAPHGVSAGLIDRLLTAASSAGVELVVVDASADFRFADPAAYASVYGHPHECPARRTPAASRPRCCCRSCRS